MHLFEPEVLRKSPGSQIEIARDTQSSIAYQLRTIFCVIGSSGVISFHVMFEPMLKPRGSDDLDHERDITLAIHTTIPDLISNTNRPVIQAGSGCLMALA